MPEGLKKFGQYFLLDHIAQGGMAEIYRARLASRDGAGRIIVIKRIQPGYGTDTEFLRMFKSEIKVTMGFNHPNIVQLYDFGELQNQPYIAMEMVDGRNLRQFMSRFSELKRPFPIELAIYIAEQASSGLHYAHSFKDKISGEPFNIVHRDISPQNILISYEGNIKVIDFGIAKAATNNESTRAGVIKGKPSYLSPEQISGEILDGRSDIFALGTVLWETLTGKKLFSGENDLAVLKLIESCQTHVKPPSLHNPKVPKELDFIVLKSLAKQRENRYQSAEELQRALHKLLYTFMPEFNPSDLSYYAKDLFKNEIVEDRKKIQKLNDKAEQLLSLELSDRIGESSETENGSESDEITQVNRSHNKDPSDKKELVINEKEGDRDTKVNLEAMPLHSPKMSPTFRQSSGLSLTPKPAIRSTTSTYSGNINTSAPQQRIPAKSTPNWGVGTFGIIGTVMIGVLAIFGPEFGIKIPFLSDLIGDWIGGNEARLVLEGNQTGVVVAINGQTVAKALPASIKGLTVETPFRVTVTGTNGTFQQEVSLHKGEMKTIPVIFTPSTTTPEKTTPSSNLTSGILPAPNERTILLKLNLSPGGGSSTILLNGNRVDPSNPMIQVALNSPLELSVERSGFKTFQREFVLDARQMAGLREWLIDIPLEPLKFGYLTLHTTPSSDATIPLEGGTPWKRKTPLENEKLPVGQYTIRLTNEVLGMEKIVNVTIEEGKSINIDEKLEIGK